MGCCGDNFGKESIASIRPYKSRSCTDIIPFLLYAACWGGIIFVAIYAMNNGNYWKVIRGTDVWGRTCGISSGVEDQPLTAFPNPADTSVMICVDDCAFTNVNGNTMMQVPYESSALFGYCVPNDETSASGFTSVYNSATQQITRTLGDVITSWPILVASLGSAVLFSFIYISFVRIFGSMIVWSILSLIAAGCALSGIILLQKANNLSSTSGSDYVDSLSSDASIKLYMQALAYALFGLTGIFILLILFLRKRIKIAAEIIRESAAALGTMRSIFFFPLIPFVFLAGYLFFWVVIALSLYSVGDPATTPLPSGFNFATGLPSNMIVYEWNTTARYYFIFHFFALLWTAQFVLYFIYLVVAGAVADFYFNPASTSNSVVPSSLSASTDAKASAVSPLPVLRSFLRTFRFHLGTVAFASLVLAIVQFIRAVVLFLERQSKAKKNRVQRCLSCVVQCCLKCVECCLDKLSRNALVYCAVYGTNFCSSSASSFSLIWSNLARAVAVTYVSSFLIFLGKLIVSLLSAGVCVVLLTYIEPYKSSVSSVFVPCIFVFVSAYFIASVLMIVFSTAVDTIFLCFLIDEDKNRNGTMMASPALRYIVGNLDKLASNGGSSAVVEMSSNTQVKVNDSSSSSSSPSPKPTVSSPNNRQQTFQKTKSRVR